MRVLVCGSRSAWDAAGVWAKLDALRPAPDMIIAGGASGVDTFAQEWANRRGLPCMVFPAAWDGPSKREAGGIRNGWMLHYGRPDLVVAFPGGHGTEDMVKRAKAAGVPVKKVALT